MSRAATTIATAAILASFFTGCASVPLAGPAQDLESKRFVAPAGKARIYVVRTGGYISGTYQLFRIGLNRQDYGPLSDGTYFMLTVDPGSHTVVASGNENEDGTRLAAEPGKNYFVAVRSRIGVANARVSVSQMEEVEGRAAVLDSRLAAVR